MYFLVSSSSTFSQFLHKLLLIDCVAFQLKDTDPSPNPSHRQGLKKQGGMGEKSELSQYPSDCTLEACCCTTISPWSLFICLSMNMLQRHRDVGQAHWKEECRSHAAFIMFPDRVRCSFLHCGVRLSHRRGDTCALGTQVKFHLPPGDFPQCFSTPSATHSSVIFPAVLDQSFSV